ncbi:hypothetical protein RJ639_044090 [Escallonia herrerae]|uniref:Protein FAR1-RELATED SEQUENCE n=1 Tax=Escallonia herrerae TaxID=1293975 RepID=A0AA89B4A9_9ASTE|nr:hypothetical protein RJ639_044090 [Escallonia herrerae]
MTVRAKPTGLVVLKTNGHREDEGESKAEPYVGLEFNSAEDAQEVYSLYATQVGFRIRIGQLYRSRVDGSVVSRRFVCSKEGFQTNSRTGCPAFIRVQRADSGKWVLANITKEHNHELELPGEIRPPHIQRKALPTPRSSTVVSSRTGIRSRDEDGPSGVIDLKRLKREEEEGEPWVEPVGEPYKGLEFNSANEAYKFYSTYAADTGFRVRIGQLFRSKHDGSITSRRFVCSKEGHQHPSRVGCSAFMRIQRQDLGRWIVDRLSKEHNHALDSPTDTSRNIAATSKAFKEEVSSGLENLDLIETNGGLSLVKRGRYEKGIEQRREEEREEDHNSFNLQTVLHTKDPIEEQCRRLYTSTMFKVFQKELLECFNYVGLKINVEGAISRYLVQKCGNGDERNTVAINASNLNISCSCRMFEFEGVLCRHALKVYQIVNLRELPSRYILHRWTKNAKYGVLRDIDSGGGSLDLKALMLWTLREEANNYIEVGAATLERYKLAFEIMQEGRRNICWQN